MIFNDPRFHWISVVPSNSDFPLAYKGQLLNKQDYLEHWGKWIIIENRGHLDELATKLDPSVESRAIHSIKYTREPERELGMDECAMLVFCDDRERDEVWEILSGFGVTLQAWVYDRQTIEMWMPGGLLIEAWIGAHGLEGEAAEEVRRETQRKYDEWLSFIGEHGEQTGGPWSFELM